MGITVTCLLLNAVAIHLCVPTVISNLMCYKSQSIYCTYILVPITNLSYNLMFLVLTLCKGTHTVIAGILHIWTDVNQLTFTCFLKASPHIG